MIHLYVTGKVMNSICYFYTLNIDKDKINLKEQGQTVEVHKRHRLLSATMDEIRNFSNNKSSLRRDIQAGISKDSEVARYKDGGLLHWYFFLQNNQAH